MLFQGLDVEGFFSRNKIRFSVNLYYNVRIIITIWSANVFYVFPTSEKLWEYFAKQKKNLHFLWNYSLANMTHIKKLHITKNCHEKKIIALVQKLSKTWHFGIKKKKTIWRKKIIFMSLDGIEFLLLWRTVSSADWWKLSPLGNYTHENPKMKVSIIKQATHSLEIEDFLCEINFRRKYPKNCHFRLL